MTVSVARPAPRPGHRLPPAIRFGTRSSFLLILTSVFGAAAYAWPADLTDEQILEKLLEMNLAGAGK